MMGEEYSLFDFPSKKQNEGSPLWKPKEITPETKATGFLSLSAPVGCCEFVGKLVAAGCDGRFCSDGTFCSPKVFADAKVFVTCPTRKDRLKIKQGT
jgi:hypothetical protein